MFKKANKNELRTWMIGDLFLVLILLFSSLALFQQFTEDVKDPNISYLIFGFVFIVVAFICLFFFYKMILAFRNYDERMAALEKEQEEERLQREAEEKERLQSEEEERKKFIEEYQKKVQEAEEQRKLAQEQKGNK